MKMEVQQYATSARRMEKKECGRETIVVKPDFLSP
jgi:hypothetical protein